MKTIVELDSNLGSNEIVIKCKEKNDLIKEIQKFIENLNNKMIFYQNGREFYLNLNDIIFFETDINSISAHTVNNCYYVKYRLYELENMLPSNFVRISRSTIVNINHVLAINKSFASSRIIEFYKTHKTVFVSRFYYKNLKEKMKERF